MTEASNAVAVKDQSSVIAAEEAAFLQDLKTEAAGSVRVRKKLLKIPQLKLGNALSDAVKGKMSDLGDFSCFVTGVNYGPSVKLIVLDVSESASLMTDKGNELLCSTRDLVTNREGVPCKQCPHDQYWDDWGTKVTKKIPKCKTSIDMIVLALHPSEAITAESAGPASMMRIAFRKTNNPAGKKLLNLLAYDNRGVPFGSSYTIFSKEESRDGNDYFVVDAKRMNKTPLTMDELKLIAPIVRGLIDAKKSGDIEVDEEVDNVEPRESMDEVPF